MSIQLTVYPDECDAYGHLNQAAYLALFERARWELLARGPGMDAFTRAGVWPAMRRCTIDYHAGVWPGDILAFEVLLVSRGRTSFTLTQRAVRTRDLRLVAEAEMVFVCIDRTEQPVAVPDDILAALTAAPRLVALADGTSLALDDAGHGGVPVLFVHGYPLDRTLWRAQMEGITGHRVVAPDLRGFGASPLAGGGRPWRNTPTTSLRCSTCSGLIALCSSGSRWAATSPSNACVATGIACGDSC